MGLSSVFIRPPSAVRAFTWVELLSVIAIIGVLAAILIPVVSSARAGAHTSKCTVNLRSIGVAGMLYSQDHKGQFSSSRLYNSSSADEPGLKEYFDNNAMHPVFTCPALAGYGVVHTYTVALVATNNTTPGPRALVYRRAVEFPEKTAWMLDGAWFDPSWFSSYMIPQDADLARLVYPHKGRENVLFVDGHVESADRERLADRNATIWSGLRSR